MDTPLRLWIHGTCNPALRCGGWAWARSWGEQQAGAAGGARGVVEPLPMALAALEAALADLPKDLAAPLLIHVQAAEFAAAARALVTRPAQFVAAPAQPRSPGAFVAAWAELARDKAKATGAFASPIPKPNLAKGLNAG